MMTAQDEEAFVRLTEELQRPPLNAWMGLEPLSVDTERQKVVVRLPFRRELSYDPDQNVFHGGVLAALADISGYAAVAVWHGGSTPTITLSLDYLSPAVGCEVVACAQVRKRGRMVGRVDIELSIDGRLVALARGTFSTASLANSSQ
jgi:uncharacterized protein (TIGR00369 family)